MNKVQENDDGKQAKYKPAIQSQTIISAIVIIICNIGVLAGWNLNTEKVTIVVTALTSIVGSAYVIWRRFKVTSRISGILSEQNTNPDQQT